MSATVNNSRRFYGVIVDQEALKAASLLHFQDEAASLELNRKMHALLQLQKEETLPVYADQKRPAADQLSEAARKRVKPDNVDSTSVLGEMDVVRHVQKFRYVQPEGNGSSQGYRLLLATYADVSAAAEDDADRERRIKAACESGGNFVGGYFYQYEVCCVLLLDWIHCARRRYQVFFSRTLNLSMKQNFRSSASHWKLERIFELQIQM